MRIIRISMFENQGVRVFWKIFLTSVNRLGPQALISYELIFLNRRMAPDQQTIPGWLGLIFSAVKFQT